jgi:hypothetical protein
MAIARERWPVGDWITRDLQFSTFRSTVRKGGRLPRGKHVFVRHVSFLEARRLTSCHPRVDTTSSTQCNISLATDTQLVCTGRIEMTL